MKHTLLAILLFCFFCNAGAQVIEASSLTRIGIYGGAGLATSNNYNLGLSGGIDFDKTILSRTQIGALVFLQEYSLFYDNEANSEKHGQGDAGVTLRHDSKYIFIAPQLKIHLWHQLNFISWLNVNAGIGMRMSGYDSLHKWNHNYDSLTVGRFDSTIDASKNINSMVFRLGVGFTQDIYLGGGNWWFTIKEDFGYLFSGLTKTADISDPNRTPYSPQKLNPGYVSLQIGISYLKNKTRIK